MDALTKEEVNNYLAHRLREWIFTGSAIRRELKFKDFTGAFSFMTAVAMEAEKMDHHPEWTNVYNTVNISLSTHTHKGVTCLDLELADRINTVYNNLTGISVD